MRRGGKEGEKQRWVMAEVLTTTGIALVIEEEYAGKQESKKAAHRLGTNR